MTSRALVLGGGGSVGIAWECGLLKGLSDAGIDVTNADLIVGTSAGSVVGSQLALGRSPDDLLAEQLAESNGSVEQAMRFDPQTFMAIATHWAGITDMNAEQRAAIGAMALSSPTVDEAAWLSVFQTTLGGVPWPERRLLLTGVDAQTGAFHAWDRSVGVSLAQAVAASCTVPGLFPPVTIDGARYIDGGVRSGTNADLARGYDVVVVIAPIGAAEQGLGGLAQRHIAAETAELRESGSAVVVVLPDADALTAFGPNLMDVTRRAVAAQAGVTQAQVAAEQIRGIWQHV